MSSHFDDDDFEWSNPEGDDASVQLSTVDHQQTYEDQNCAPPGNDISTIHTNNILPTTTHLKSVKARRPTMLPSAIKDDSSYNLDMYQNRSYTDQPSSSFIRSTMTVPQHNEITSDARLFPTPTVGLRECDNITFTDDSWSADSASVSYRDSNPTSKSDTNEGGFLTSSPSSSSSSSRPRRRQSGFINSNGQTLGVNGHGGDFTRGIPRTLELGDEIVLTGAFESFQASSPSVKKTASAMKLKHMSRRMVPPEGFPTSTSDGTTTIKSIYDFHDMSLKQANHAPTEENSEDIDLDSTLDIGGSEDLIDIRDFDPFVEINEGNDSGEAHVVRRLDFNNTDDHDIPDLGFEPCLDLLDANDCDTSNLSTGSTNDDSTNLSMIKNDVDLPPSSLSRLYDDTTYIKPFSTDTEEEEDDKLILASIESPDWSWSTASRRSLFKRFLGARRALCSSGSVYDHHHKNARVFPGEDPSDFADPDVYNDSPAELLSLLYYTEYLEMIVAQNNRLRRVFDLQALGLFDSTGALDEVSVNSQEECPIYARAALFAAKDDFVSVIPHPIPLHRARKASRATSHVTGQTVTATDSDSSTNSQSLRLSTMLPKNTRMVRFGDLYDRSKDVNPEEQPPTRQGLSTEQVIRRIQRIKEETRRRQEEEERSRLTERVLDLSSSTDIEASGYLSHSQSHSFSMSSALSPRSISSAGAGIGTGMLSPKSPSSGARYSGLSMGRSGTGFSGFDSTPFNFSQGNNSFRTAGLGDLGTSDIDIAIPLTELSGELEVEATLTEGARLGLFTPEKTERENKSTTGVNSHPPFASYSGDPANLLTSCPNSPGSPVPTMRGNAVAVPRLSMLASRPLHPISMQEHVHLENEDEKQTPNDINTDNRQEYTFQPASTSMVDPPSRPLCAIYASASEHTKEFIDDRNIPATMEIENEGNANRTQDNNDKEHSLCSDDDSQKCLQKTATTGVRMRVGFMDSLQITGEIPSHFENRLTHDEDQPLDHLPRVAPGVRLMVRPICASGVEDEKRSVVVMAENTENSALDSSMRSYTTGGDTSFDRSANGDISLTGLFAEGEMHVHLNTSDFYSTATAPQTLDSEVKTTTTRSSEVSSTNVMNSKVVTPKTTHGLRRTVTPSFRPSRATDSTKNSANCSIKSNETASLIRGPRRTQAQVGGPTSTSTSTLTPSRSLRAASISTSIGTSTIHVSSHVHGGERDSELHTIRPRPRLTSRDSRLTSTSVSRARTPSTSTGHTVTPLTASRTAVDRSLSRTRPGSSIPTPTGQGQGQASFNPSFNSTFAGATPKKPGKGRPTIMSGNTSTSTISSTLPKNGPSAGLSTIRGRNKDQLGSLSNPSTSAGVVGVGVRPISNCSNRTATPGPNSRPSTPLVSNDGVTNGPGSSITTTVSTGTNGTLGVDIAAILADLPRCPATPLPRLTQHMNQSTITRLINEYMSRVQRYQTRQRLEQRAHDHAQNFAVSHLHSFKSGGNNDTNSGATTNPGTNLNSVTGLGRPPSVDSTKASAKTRSTGPSRPLKSHVRAASSASDSATTSETKTIGTSVVGKHRRGASRA